METAKPLEFKGTALGYFLLTLVTLVFTYIPVLGWAFLLNYTAGWFADSTLINGKKVTYKAGYGESLVFIFINSLLLLITLGIYSFWFYPKMYRYVVDHTHYLDDVVMEPVPAPADTPIIESTVDPTNPPAPTDTTPTVG